MKLQKNALYKDCYGQLFYLEEIKKSILVFEKDAYTEYYLSRKDNPEMFLVVDEAVFKEFFTKEADAPNRFDRKAEVAKLERLYQKS